MSAFSFNTTYQPTGDQQKDAIAQIDIMQSRAVQANLAYQSNQDEEIRRELDVLNKQRGDDQRRIEKLGQDNAALAEQVKALGANPVTATGEPVPQMPASPPGPEGEPQPGNTPVRGMSASGVKTVSRAKW